MNAIAAVAVLIVALLHIGFLILEMFLWTTPTGRKVFGLPAEFMQASKTLAANQGLYNGFLAAGLIWGLWQGQAGCHIVEFFLGCIIVAGIFGGLTAKRSILYIQAVPGAIALAIVVMTTNVP